MLSTIDYLIIAGLLFMHKWYANSSANKGKDVEGICQCAQMQNAGFSLLDETSKLWFQYLYLQFILLIL